MKALEIFILLAFVSCAHVKTLGDCPWSDDDVSREIENYKLVNPNATGFVERVEVVCREGRSFASLSGQPAAGETSWAGSETRRARMTLATGYPSLRCSAFHHELQHVYLARRFGNPCASHETDCKWNAIELETLQVGCSKLDVNKR
jgi:hypothetical protein